MVRQSANHMCLALCLTIVTMLGLMAGMHVYRTVFIKRNYCGTYRIPLNHGIMPENTLVAANFQNPSEEDDAFKLNMFALFNHELPKNVFDILAKMRDGAFDIDYEEIRKTYHVNGPALTQFDSSHGSFIPDACSTKPTYRLEELVGNVLVKREVGSSGEKFGEFVGSKLIKYNIINLGDTK